VLISIDRKAQQVLQRCWSEWPVRLSRS